MVLRYNALNTSNIIVHRPYSGYEFSLPICEVSLPCINVETVSIEDPNGIVAHKYDKDSGNLCLTFNVEQSTPLGTYPLTINYYGPGASASSKQLQLSYTINGIIAKSKPMPKDANNMKLYTTEMEGCIESELRDYFYDPAGLDFVILDTCYEETNEDDWGTWKWMKVDIRNEKLRLEYRFEDEFGYTGQSLKFSVKVRNSYQYESEFLFELHCVDPTNITEEKVSESESIVIYNLNGQRLPQKKSELMPGVYIVNGKKKVLP